MSTEVAIITLALHGLGDPSEYSRPSPSANSSRTSTRISTFSISSLSSSSPSGCGSDCSEVTFDSDNQFDSDDDVDDFKDDSDDDFQTYETSLRGVRWRKLLGLEELKQYTSPMLYTQLVEADADCAADIRRDMHRTFPHHNFYQSEENLESLYNILHAYSIYDFGYSQGMAFLAGVLRVHMGEEDSFWSLMQMLNCKFHLRYIYCHDSALTDTLAIFEYFVKLHLPKLSKHLLDNGISSELYAAQWVVTLFAYNLSFHQIVVAWDLIVKDGILAVFKIGLAILEYFEEKLMKKSFDNAIKIFSSIHTIPLSVITNTKLMKFPEELVLENVCLSRYSSLAEDKGRSSCALIDKIKPKPKKIET